MIDSLMAQFSTASALYAEMHGIDRDADWFLLKLQEELGELTQVWNKQTGRARLKGQTQAEISKALADETADLFGHVLLLLFKMTSTSQPLLNGNGNLRLLSSIPDVVEQRQDRLLAVEIVS